MPARRRSWWGPGALLCALACAAPAPERAGAGARTPPALADAGPAPLAAGVQLGLVAGSPLSATDLLVAWHESAPREPWLIVDRIVSTRLALLEAARLGLAVEPERIAAAVALERRRQTAELERAAGGTALDDFLRGELGLDPPAYWAALERRTLERLAIERVVRAWTLSAPTRAVRLLAVPDDGGIEAVQRRLASGEDFVALLRELSLDDSRAADGLVPFLIDDPRSPLARVAMLTEVGSVGGPVRTVGHDVLLRVEQARVPLMGSWAEVGPAVEASLAQHPLGDVEYVPWKLAMRRSHPVDLAPLEKLFQAP